MKLYIAGHNGMVGSALVRRFESEPGVTLLLRSRKELDLTSQAAVEEWGDKEVLWHCERSDGVRVFLGDSYGRSHRVSFPAERKLADRLLWFGPHAGTTSSNLRIGTSSFRV